MELSAAAVREGRRGEATPPAATGSASACAPPRRNAGGPPRHTCAGCAALLFKRPFWGLSESGAARPAHVWRGGPPALRLGGARAAETLPVVACCCRGSPCLSSPLGLRRGDCRELARRLLQPRQERRNHNNATCSVAEAAAEALSGGRAAAPSSPPARLPACLSPGLPLQRRSRLGARRGEGAQARGRQAAAVVAAGPQPRPRERPPPPSSSLLQETESASRAGSSLRGCLFWRRRAGGVGCIHYEMVTGRPMFPGSTVKEELHLIFRLLGTPTEESWPGITSNEEFKAYSFTQYRVQPLINHAPRLDTEGIDLLMSLLLYDARSRISAELALRHPYFMTLGERVHLLPETASIFSLKEIQLQKDPGYRGSGFQHSARGKNRRQSIF